MPSIVPCAKTTPPRDRVRDVAAGLFADRGLDGFKMRDLAERLGVSVMTPYRYFENKEAILACVRAHGFACLADALDRGRAAGPLEQRVLDLATAYGAFAMAQPARYRLMFTLAPAQTPNGASSGGRVGRRAWPRCGARNAGWTTPSPPMPPAWRRRACPVPIPPVWAACCGPPCTAWPSCIWVASCRRPT